MNIIGGDKRGAKLATCNSTAVRPTGQRTREALFNILQGGRFSVSVAGAVVIDLFAGTGAIGLEALSRGQITPCLLNRTAAPLRLCKPISPSWMQSRSVILAQDALTMTLASSGRRSDFADRLMTAVRPDRRLTDCLMSGLSARKP